MNIIGHKAIMREPIPLRMAGAGQYVTFSDFGVGSVIVLLTVYSPETTFVLQQPKHPHGRQRQPERYCFPAPPERSANRGVKFSCRLQFGEFQPLVAASATGVKNFSLKKRVTRALSLPALPNPYTVLDHKSYGT